MDLELAKARIAATAAELDRVIPDWRSRITQPINIREWWTDPIGQIWGSFWDADLSALGYIPTRRGNEEMRDRIKWAITRGICVVGNPDDPQYDIDCATLSELWRHQLTQTFYPIRRGLLERALVPHGIRIS